MVLIDEIQYVELNDNEILMLNLVNGAADILDRETYETIINNKVDQLDKSITERLLSRRYAFKSDEEKEKFIQGIDEQIDKSEKSTIPNFLIIPTYACNLSCTYCYEKAYEINKIKSDEYKRIIDKQFDFISKEITNFKNSTGKEFEMKDVKITLMGGEPLMKANYDKIIYALNKIKENGYSFNAITNGVDLEYYIDDLNRFGVECIQVTLDGPKEIHDTRRIYANGNGSFDKIFRNIKLALQSNIKVIVRTNVDSGNLEALPKLAELLYDNFNMYENFSSYIYILQDGGCIGQKDILNENIAIDKIYKLELENSKMKIFNKRYHGFKFINGIFNNEKFMPTLRHCSSETNQYILDYKGYVYKCWHGIGNEGNSIGKYIPEIKLNEASANKWNNRTSRTINKCKTCKYRYICSGGCPGIDTNNGILEPERPYCVDYDLIFKSLISIMLNRR